jgi:HlyD family secretion protein
MKRYFFIILFLIFILLGVSFYKIVQLKKVKFVTAQEKTVKKVVYASGYVKPIHYVIVESEVSGYVKKIYVKEGDWVKKGDLLAELEPRELPSKIAEIEKRLALVEERLRSDSEYLKSLRNEIEIAQSTYHLDEKKLLRRKELYKEGLISRENLEEAERAYRASKEALEKAKNLYVDTIKALKTERETLLKEKEALKEELAKYYVRAPISGKVLKKYVEVGEFVYPIFSENKLFSLGSSEKEILLEVDEEYASLVKEGQKIYLTFDSFPEKVFEGTLTQIIREVDRTKRSFIVKAKLKEEIDLPALATAEGNILIEERKALLIPQKALLPGDIVEIKGRGRVKIKRGERFEDYIEVLSGIRAGEVVRIFE